MTAFRIEGVSEYICFEICEVFGFPTEVAYGGGYGVRGTISIQVGQRYNVEATCFCTTGELCRFYQALRACYDSLSGCARFESVEHQLELNCAFDRTGHVRVSGMFCEYASCQNQLQFELLTDQTQIRHALFTLSELSKQFGNDNGVLSS